MKKKSEEQNTDQARKQNHGVLFRYMRLAFRSLMAILTGIFLLIFLSAAFSDLISPLRFVYPSFLGLGFGALSVIAIIWLVLLILCHRWPSTIAMVIGLIIAHEPMWRYCPLHLSSQEPITNVYTIDGKQHTYPVDSIRLLTYNTCQMGQTHLSKIKEDIPVMNFIRETKADIVCLQEYGFSLSKKGHTEEQLRNSLKDLYPYYDFLRYPGSKALGLAVYSRFPIVKSTRIDKSEKKYITSIHYTLDIHGRKVTLVNNHLKNTGIAMEDRVFTEGMIEHFEKDGIGRIKQSVMRSLSKAYIERAKQSNTIRRYLEEKTDKSLPTIICGDMNDTPVSYSYRTMKGSLCDTWEEVGFGTGTTYNRHHFLFRIDHIFHSEHFRALDVKVLNQYKYSDHYPVLATFQLLPEEKDNK